MVPFPAIKLEQSLRAFTKVSVDYGRSFISIQGRGRKRVKWTLKSKIEKSAANSGIKEHFNLLLGPNFGGVHETMIKEAKRAIYGTVSQVDIIDEELSTAFLQVQKISSIPGY